MHPVDGLVLSAPALAADMCAAQKLLLAVVGRLTPSLRLGNSLRPAWLSRDAAAVRAYLADLLIPDRITPLLARFIPDAGACTQSRAGACALPTLLLCAGSD